MATRFYRMPIPLAERVAGGFLALAYFALIIVTAAPH